MGDSETYAITVPAPLAAVIEELVHQQAERFGETPDAARRLVEITVLQRGAAALQAELAGEARS